MTDRPLRAVLVDHAGDPASVTRLIKCLAAALDGTGPALLPIDAGLPHSRILELLNTFKPAEVDAAGGISHVRYDSTGVSEDTSVIVTTSGSTGVPKGVDLTAAALLASARASLARIGAESGDRWLLCLPPAHIAGLQVLTRSLLSGTDPVIAGQADAATLRGSGASHVSLVPTQLRRLGPDTGVLNTFKSVLLGGAAAAAALIEQARTAGAPVITTYGMTETCGGCVYDGLPLDGVRVEIRDERIWLQGAVLFRGYVGGPRGDSREGASGAGQGAVHGADYGADYGAGQGGWFQTSDLGRIDPGTGLLEVRGRADDVIVTGGHKVVPAEVTRALLECPGVRDAAVLGQPDAEWGERVVAVLVADDPRDPPALKILGNCVKARLPRYACPSRVVLVDAIPMLPSGKPDLVRLRREVSESRAGTN